MSLTLLGKSVKCLVSYRNAINYLTTKTKVIELCNQLGARVAVCPDWNGRVMTSTSDGLDGNSFGLVNVYEIDRISLPAENSYSSSFLFCGGEDQLTLSPEGGPFSLYYAEPKIAHKNKSTIPIQFPNGYRESVFLVDTVPPAPEVRMRQSLQMTNIAGVRFDLDIVRTVKLLESKDVAAAFGRSVATTLEQTDVSYVGFMSSNSLLNRGVSHTKSSGLVSMRIRSMFNSSPNTIAVVPFQMGEKEILGPCVCTDFFGTAPHGRVRLFPQAALLRADSKYRCQVGVSRKRAMPFLGSIDFREGILTLQTFNMPEHPWESAYLCNDYCETSENTADFVRTREHYLEQLSNKKLQTVSGCAHCEEACFTGEVVRAYNHGPTLPGQPVSSFFYEFDTYSPAKELVRGESLTHSQCTLHINADNTTLSFLAEKILGVSYEKVFEKMIK